MPVLCTRCLRHQQTNNDHEKDDHGRRAGALPRDRNFLHFFFAFLSFLIAPLGWLAGVAIRRVIYNLRRHTI